MNVDLPAPGAPLIPTRIATPAPGISAWSNVIASSRWSSRVDSTSVMARARARRSPPRTASASPRLIPASRGSAAFAYQREDLRGRPRDVATRPEDRAHSRRAHALVVARRDDPADHDDDLAGTLRAQRLDELWHECLVAGGLAGDADDVDIVLDRFARRFVGSLEQRTDVHVEAEIGEGGRDHFGTA